MCGILAVFCNSAPKNLQTILNSSKILARRGPDKCSSIITSKGIFIFHRLAIHDTSSAGDQPMISGNILMMCNGEIYNYKQLIKDYHLKCESNSDCEVILRLYEKIGFTDTVKALDGVFAIVLQDKDKEIVYVARDRIGVRPLFSGWTKEGNLAVSSIPNVLIPFCTNVAPILSGGIAFYRDSEPNNLTYIYNNEVSILPKIKDNFLQVVQQGLISAVQKRLTSDRPIGCLLSGGLDSSIIASILSKLMGPQNVRTYSIGMEGSTDLFYARKVADYLGTIHTEVRFTPEEGFAVIPEVVELLASYDITTIRASVGMYLLCKYISEKTTDRVIFSGEGSDEIFSGYLYFHNAPNAEECEQESLRLTNQLDLYDVLRADRMISSNGLEMREPFLDKQFVDLVMSLPAEVKLPKPIEKNLLREAFVDFLPCDVLYRQKCAFSDGVSSVKKSWRHHIQEMTETKISDEIFNPFYPSKEAMYYRLIFDRLFPNYNLVVPYWMPKWSDAKDPSARDLKVCLEKDIE